MDKIRKALDLARLERTQSAEGAGAAERTVTSLPARMPPHPIVYSRTRVLRPPAEQLLENRVLASSAADHGAAAFRMLRTQVLHRMEANRWRTLAIFSPGAEEGKTTTAINLAVHLASDLHHTVLLVELDFKRPTLAQRFGFSPELGVDDVLIGNATVDECLYHPEGFERLVVLPARQTLEHSSEILAGPRCRELVGELRSRYEERLVLFDLPPVLLADDALSFSPFVECGLVVAAEGLTRRADLARTVELLHRTPLVGTVLNRAGDVPKAH